MKCFYATKYRLKPYPEGGNAKYTVSHPRSILFKVKRSDCELSCTEISHDHFANAEVWRSRSDFQARRKVWRCCSPEVHQKVAFEIVLHAAAHNTVDHFWLLASFSIKLHTACSPWGPAYFSTNCLFTTLCNVYYFYLDGDSTILKPLLCLMSSKNWLFHRLFLKQYKWPRQYSLRHVTFASPRSFQLRAAN